ncbi:MAG: pyridoxal-phosphate dependent enzyme, partial [Candidatus Dormibacteria bacterium]
ATLRLGQLCWEVISAEVGEIVTVNDRQLADALWWLWTRCKLLVEPTGALAVAAALGGALGSLSEGGSSEVVCVISGGNCLPQQISELVERRTEATGTA